MARKREILGRQPGFLVGAAQDGRARGRRRPMADQLRERSTADSSSDKPTGGAASCSRLRTKTLHWPISQMAATMRADPSPWAESGGRDRPPARMKGVASSLTSLRKTAVSKSDSSSRHSRAWNRKNPREAPVGLAARLLQFFDNGLINNFKR
jgi:hypothetical protein